ncbi:MAG: hypothetical protein ACE5IC_10820, partial [Candidatus Brocadiales bacterium]
CRGLLVIMQFELIVFISFSGSFYLPEGSGNFKFFFRYLVDLLVRLMTTFTLIMQTLPKIPFLKEAVPPNRHFRTPKFDVGLKGLFVAMFPESITYS